MKFSCTFQATGTTWIIDAESRGGFVAAEIETEIRNKLEEFENVYSRFRHDSLVAQIAKAAGQYIFPEDARELFALYGKMYEATDGLVTPLIGQVISDAGYDAAYSLVPKNLPNEMQSAKKWEDVMEYKHPVLTVREPVMLDFGAIGKGYAIDSVGRLLQEKGFENYTVNAGGDILCRGALKNSALRNSVNYNSEHDESDERDISHVRVGLEHPNNPKQAIGVAEISNQSMCGSAGNRRAWGDYHHIINPKTATSPRHISAVWVVVDAEAGTIDGASSSGNGKGNGNANMSIDSTAIADALTTGLFFAEPEALAQKTGFAFEYLIVYADNTMRRSEHFPAKMF
jgi:thiamine biosynthesis lipoprotein